MSNPLTATRTRGRACARARGIKHCARLPSPRRPALPIVCRHARLAEHGGQTPGAMDQRLHGHGETRSQAGAFAFLLLAGALLIGSLLVPTFGQPPGEMPGAERPTHGNR